MRLIDANDLLKEKTILWDEALGFCDCVLVEDIDKAPTVDAVEVVHGRWIAVPFKNKDDVRVVRCQNCQYSEPCKPYNKVWCPKMGRYMKQDGFCSEGVMKDA